MAALIDPLASGLAGCAGGSVLVYQRGTVIAATLYTGQDATGGTTGTAGVHTLDANAAIIRYTTEPLDITARDSAGATVRSFTFQGNAGNLEVKQSGFNSGNATNLGVVLAAEYTSSGATDHKVLYNGAETLLQDAITAVNAKIFNVKSTAYAAVGNGVNDDTAEIQAAITACAAAGGGTVFFPPGTYLISGALTIGNAGVRLQGSGRSASYLKQSSTTANWVTITASGPSFESLSFTTTVAAAGICISSSGLLVTVIDCEFSGTGTGAQFSGCGALIGCTHTPGTTTAYAATSGNGLLQVIGGSLFTHTSSTANGQFVASSSGGTLIASGLRVQVSGSTSGTLSVFYYESAVCIASGVVLGNSGGATVTVYNGATAGALREHGTYLGSTPNTLLAASPATSANTVQSATRDLETVTTVVAGTSYTPSINFKRHNVTHTSGASMVINNPASTMPTGWTIVVYYQNNSGGSITPTFGAGFNKGTVTAVANGSRSIWYFEAMTAGAYYEVASRQNF